MSGSLFAIALVFCSTLSLFGQCPSEGKETEARALQGRLIFYDGIVKWFQLKLDQPQCGESTIELFAQDPNLLAVFRGCRIKSQGALIISTRGNVRQIVKQIDAVGRCSYKPPFPDFSNVKPDSTIREYRVEMHVNGSRPIRFRVLQAGKTLRPWQAYASYLLTGGSVLYGWCADGFVLDTVFGPAEANPGHSEEDRSAIDQATFDLDRAAGFGKKNPDLGFTCVRP